MPAHVLSRCWKSTWYSLSRNTRNNRSGFIFLVSAFAAPAGLFIRRVLLCVNAQMGWRPVASKRAFTFMRILRNLLEEDLPQERGSGVLTGCLPNERILYHVVGAAEHANGLQSRRPLAPNNSCAPWRNATSNLWHVFHRQSEPGILPLKRW